MEEARFLTISGSVDDPSGGIPSYSFKVDFGMAVDV
jgi:hypothetical protein